MGLNNMDWPGEAIDTSGHMSAKAGEEANAKPKVKPDIASARAGGREADNTKLGRAYVQLKKAKVDAWFKKLASEKPPPTEAQLRYLHAVRDRCQTEWSEMVDNSERRRERYSEPLRTALLGVPGAGKSECIRWTRRFFEECLGGVYAPLRRPFV